MQLCHELSDKYLLAFTKINIHLSQLEINVIVQINLIWKYQKITFSCLLILAHFLNSCKKYCDFSVLTIHIAFGGNVSTYQAVF